MKRSVIVALVAIAVLLATVTSCSIGGKTNVSQVVQVSRDTLTLKISGNGRLVPAADEQLAFATAGRVAKINYIKGDRVSKGTILATLDTAALNYTLAQAEAAVEQADYSYQKLLEVPLPAEVASARAAVTAAEEAQKAIKSNEANIKDNLQAAKDALAYAKIIYDKAVQHIYILDIDEIQLTSNISAAQVQVTRWQTELDNLKDNMASETATAAANLESAKAYLATLTEPPTAAAINAAKVAVQSAEQNVAEIKRQIADAVIMATVDGVVAEEVGAKEGDTVAAGQAVFHIVDLSRMDLEVKVDEMDVPGVASGQKAFLTFDAIPNRKLDGTVTYISPLPLETGGVVQYMATVSFAVPQDLNIKAGMSARAEIVTREKQDVVLVPDAAISHDASGKTVVKVTANGVTQDRPVVTGITDGTRTEIVSGLDAGETIVIQKNAA